jgi:hypothetical protein
MIKKTILASILGSLVLVGCGESGGSGGSGGSDGGSGSTTSVSGYAIDGYITGATVFLDKNFNGVLDSGEPNATTDSTGQYVLNLEGEVCKNSAPLVVSVPANAIDLDNPNTPIGEAYTLTMPPNAYLVSGNQEDVHVTPLTTMLWSSIYSEALNQDIELDCNQLATANSEQEVWLLDQLATSETEVAASLGVSDKNDLYSDYVEANDTALHTTAQNIVTDLKEVEKVKDAAPSGSKAFLMDHSSLEEYGITPNNSTKYVLTVTESSDGSYGEKITDLNDANTVYFESKGQRTENSTHLNESEVVFVSSSGSTGSCEVIDMSREKAATHYKIVTKEKTASGVTDVDNCPTTGTSEQTVTTVVSSTVDAAQGPVTTSHTSVAVYSTPLEAMPTISSNADTEAFILAIKGHVSGMENFETNFDDNALTPDSWVRTYKEAHTIIFGSDTKSHEVTRDQGGIWTKTLPNTKEYFCMSQYVVGNGNDPMEAWDQETTTGSNAVWVKAPSSSLVGKTIHQLCTENQAYWATDTIYWPITSATPGF